MSHVGNVIAFIAGSCRDIDRPNVKGSEIYTQLIARQIADALKKQP